MEEPPGYPPPTLVRRRSAKGRLAFFVAIVILAAAVGFFVVSRLTENSAPAPVAQEPAAAEPKPVQLEPAPPEPAPPPPNPVGDADAKAAALPDAAKAAPGAAPAPAPVAVDDATADAPARPAGKARDARPANLWYYVGRLGDGPGAIYSRDGRQWNFAFACTLKTHMIEFIAVGTGSPGGFDKQSMGAGQVRLEMDGTYSKDGGGIISSKLPASHAIFTTLLGGKDPLEVQLVASHKTVLPVSPGLIRLIKTCRG